MRHSSKIQHYTDKQVVTTPDIAVISVSISKIVKQQISRWLAACIHYTVMIAAIPDPEMAIKASMAAFQAVHQASLPASTRDAASWR